MSETNPFLGLRTVLYHVPDMAKAKAWYSSILGAAPYFDEPFYIGFNVAGYEVGLHPGTPGNAEINHAVVSYLGVADADSAHARLVSLGAKAHEPVKDVGEGIKVATVLDPFGNVFGIIENPHFNLTNK
jgi:predicted enzyme related to lactoylglutathione lyase